MIYEKAGMREIHDEGRHPDQMKKEKHKNKALKSFNGTKKI